MVETTQSRFDQDLHDLGLPTGAMFNFSPYIEYVRA